MERSLRKSEPKVSFKVVASGEVGLFIIRPLVSLIFDYLIFKPSVDRVLILSFHPFPLYTLFIFL